MDSLCYSMGNIYNVLKTLIPQETDSEMEIRAQEDYWTVFLGLIVQPGNLHQVSRPENDPLWFSASLSHLSFSMKISTCLHLSGFSRTCKK